ncbi:U-box domain-containing protein 44-like isoform X2, partial [Fagus crenata]
VSKLSKDMLDSVYKYWVNVAEEEVVKKIDLGIQARNFDRSYANHLLGKITEAVGISTEQSELKKEFEEFKREIEDLQR